MSKKQDPHVEELIHASDAGNLDTLAGPRVNRDLIESLKSKVEFFIRSDARRALELADLAVRLIAQTPDPIAAALALRTKAMSLYALGRYAEAVDLWQAAFDLYASNGITPDAAAVQRSMVDALGYLGKYDEALGLAEEVRSQLVGLNDTLALAKLDTNLGNIYHRMDRNSEALEHYERALSVFQAKGEILGTALTSFNTANVYCNLHDFVKARERYQLAESLYRQKGMDLAAAQTRYSLGYLHFLTGSYHQAMRVLIQVEADFDRLGDSRAAALCLLDLSEIYLQMNVLDDAAELARRAHGRFAELGMRYEGAKALTYLGLAQLGMSHLEEADASLANARDDFVTEGNTLYVGLIAAYRSDLELYRGSPETALVRLQEASAIFERNDLGVKQCLARFIEAKAWHAADRSDIAIQRCKEILERLAHVEAPWLECQVRELLGDLMLEQNDQTQAYEEYLKAVRSVELRRAGIRVDEFRSAFFRDKLKVYEKLILLCLEQSTKEKREEAFFYLESRKARTLVDMLTNDLEAWPEADSPDSDLRQEWKRIKDQLHWLRSKISENEEHGENRSRAIEGNLHTEIRNREQALEALTRRAQLRDPHFAALNGTSGLTVEELRAVLGQNDALIEYYANGDRLMAFVVNHRDIHVVPLLGSISKVSDHAMELRFLTEKFQYGAAYANTHREFLLQCVNDSLQKLHQILFEPLVPLLEGRRLIFVPFGVLHKIPFHALFDGQDYVIDRHDVTYAPSARLYTLCQSRAAYPRNKISIFGVPDDLAPQIRGEVEAIKGCFPEAQCFIGAEASREAFARSLASSDILHIASHAVFRHDNPMFSAIRLSDQWLDAYDIGSLRLNSAMVTLSGCSTGAGRVYAGDEILGLVRGFLKAGACSLVVSLWPVNDPAAASLMSLFYERLRRGESAGTALRNAVLQLKKRYLNPYYWAPFVLIGQN